MKKLISKFKNLFTGEKMTEDNSHEIESKYFNDDKSKLICQYCLSEMKTITASHLKMHDMTMVEYRERFPYAPLKVKRNKIIKSNIIFDKTKAGFKKIDLPIKNSIPDNIIQPKKIQPQEEIKPPKETFGKDQIIRTKDAVFKLLQEVYPHAKRNHIFKKTNIDGNILYTVMTDFADVTKRIMIDFSGMAWHIKTPLLTKYRKKDLLNESKWKYLNIENEDMTADEIRDILNIK